MKYYPLEQRELDFKGKEADLGKEHESIVCSEVFLQELHTVSLKGWNCILLGCIESGHHGLRSDLDFIRIQEPEKDQMDNN